MLMMNNNNSTAADFGAGGDITAAVLDLSELLLAQLSSSTASSATTILPSATTTSSPFLLLHPNATATATTNSSSPTAILLSSASIASRNNIKAIKMIAYCYILPVVCVLGIIGNLMNVVTLASPRLRAVSYMYLRALAIADLLCMCFVLVFASCEVLKEVGGLPIDRHPLFGFYQAHLMLSFINWTLSTGVLIVVALSLERYVSVVFPLHFRVWNSPQRAMKAILAAYIVPAVFYIPYGIGRYTVKENVAPNGDVFYIPDDSAVSKTLGWQIYKWTREGLLRFLPIVILFVLNSQIMIAFRRRQAMFNRLRNRDNKASQQTTLARDDTLLYILGGIAVMFFVCNIPAAINLLFINETVKKRLDYQIFRAVANLLEITNHAAQFYIFCVCSSDYRVTFMQKFPCLRAYYVNKNKFRSFIRNVPMPKRSGALLSERSEGGGATTTINGGIDGSGDGGGAGGKAAMLVMRRAQSEKHVNDKKAGSKDKGGSTKNGHPPQHRQQQQQKGGDAGMMLGMRSITVTGDELVSTCEGKVAEQETVDSRVQLASEESLSDESDLLLMMNNCTTNSSSGHVSEQYATSRWCGGGRDPHATQQDHHPSNCSSQQLVDLQHCGGMQQQQQQTGVMSRTNTQDDDSGTCFL